MSPEVYCVINIEDSQSAQILTITGKVNRKQIFSLVDSWISISNIILRNGIWEKVDNTIPKASIKQLSINKIKKTYTFEKESLDLHQIILNNSLPVSIS